MEDKDYMFVDEVTGEEFFVETFDYIDAIGVARANFEKPKFVGVYSIEEAEAIGLDTY